MKLKLSIIGALCAGIISAQNLVAAFEPGTLRTDYAGYVGMQFTAASPVTVTALGRWCVAGNAQSHTVALFTAAGLMATSVALPMAGCAAGHFAYAAIPPYALAVGASYYLATLEKAGGDSWFDQGSVILASVAQPGTSIYEYNGAWYPSAAHASYGPVDLQYLVTEAVPPAQPLPVTPGYLYLQSGGAVTDVACPAGWTGAKLADGNCLAVELP